MTTTTMTTTTMTTTTTVNKKINLNLIGLDGNAFNLMGAFLDILPSLKREDSLNITVLDFWFSDST